MITPIDIQNKEFSKSLKGYKKFEVDGFLDEIIVEYESLFKENLELKDKVGYLDEKVNHYSSMEETLQKTLVMAQNSAEDVMANAREKAKLIIEDAERESKNQIGHRNKMLRELTDEYEKLKREMILYKSKCKALINSQLDIITEDFKESNLGFEKNLEELESQELDSQEFVETDKSEEIDESSAK